MYHKLKYLFFIGTMVLSGCQSLSSETSSSGDSANNSALITEDTISDTLPSEEESNPSSLESPTSEVPPSSEVVPLYDPDVPGLERSTNWPSTTLNDYLTYAKNIVMPVLTSEATFHHGIYEDDNFLEWYRVLTRIYSRESFDSYLAILTSEYDFSIEEEIDNIYYGQSMYDDVRFYLEYRYSNNVHEAIFDFFDGNGDQYDGPVAVDNLATFDLRTRDALTSRSPTSAKWEVRPATFSVYKRTSGYSVGNTNGEQLSNPLRIYPGQAAVFKVASHYYISKITLLVASGYAAETVDNGTLNLATASHEGDFVTITPTARTSEIEYMLAQVMNVGQVRWLEVRILLAKNN